MQTNIQTRHKYVHDLQRRQKDQQALLGNCVVLPGHYRQFQTVLGLGSSPSLLYKKCNVFISQFIFKIKLNSTFEVVFSRYHERFLCDHCPIHYVIHRTGWRLSCLLYPSLFPHLKKNNSKMVPPRIAAPLSQLALFVHRRQTLQCSRIPGEGTMA